MGARRALVLLTLILVCIFYTILWAGEWVEFPQLKVCHLARSGALLKPSDEINKSASILEFILSTSAAENSQDRQRETVGEQNGNTAIADVTKDSSSVAMTTLSIVQDQKTIHGDVTQSDSVSGGARIMNEESMELLPSSRLQSTRVNCQCLFGGKDEFPDEVESAIRINKSITLQPNDIINDTNNCEQYKKKRGYIMDSMTVEEESFPIAYSILMYTAPGQAERLLRAIYRPQNFYCIHVDIKADEVTRKAMKSISDCFPNVFVVPDPANVYWGEFGVLEAEIICMELLVKFKWKYFINLTGHEFPLASNYKIVKVLKTYNGANEIANELITKFLRSRWKFIHVHGKGNTNQSKPELPPSNITIYKGSAHVVLSRNFVDYILNDPVPRQFLNWTKDVSCPEEIFFSSLQHNTHLEAPGTFTEHNNELRYPISRHKVWRHDFHRKTCFSHFYRNNLCIYGVEDLPSLFKDDHAFFINKLIDDFQPITYDCLEEILANRTREEYLGRREVDLDFFQHLPLVTNHY